MHFESSIMVQKDNKSKLIHGIKKVEGKREKLYPSERPGRFYWPKVQTVRAKTTSDLISMLIEADVFR